MRQHLEEYVKTAVCATKSLFDQLPVDEVSYTRESALAHNDGRSYYLYGAGSEVLKAGTAMVRWMDLISDDAKSPTQDTTALDSQTARIRRTSLEHVADEQLMWQRKLTEWLANLVCFSTSNDQGYYRLFLATELYDCRVADYIDEKYYHKCDSTNLRQEVEHIRDRIVSDLGTVNASQLWFLKEQRNVSKTLGDLKRSIQSSFSSRLKVAMRVANDAERIAMGITYAHGFGRASRSIHPTITYATKVCDTADIRRNLIHVSMLCWSIITRAHALAGIEPTGTAKGISFMAADTMGSDAMLRHRPGHSNGDLILAQGRLAEVLCRHVGMYGLESYHVRFLVRPPLPSIPEDCVPAGHTCLLFKISESRDYVAEQLGKLPEGQDALRNIDAVSDNELAAIVKGLFIELDKAGILLPLIRQGSMTDECQDT